MNRTYRASMLAAMALGAVASMGIGSAGTSSNAVDPAIQQIQELTADATATAKPAGTPARSVSLTDIQKAILASQRRGSRPSRFPNGPGWTHAHVQRMARKRRNVRRNRRAHR